MGNMLDFNLDDEPILPELANFTDIAAPKTAPAPEPIEQPVRKIMETVTETASNTENEEDTETDIEENETSRFTRPVIGNRNNTSPKYTATQKRTGRPALTNKSTIQAKAIPKDLLELARRDAGIPASVSNSNAVAAYIYMKAADKGSVTLTDELRKVIDECSGDSTVQDMNERIGTVEKELRDISKKMDELSLALNYLVLNAAGLSYDNPGRAEDVNLLEEGILDIRNQIRRQTKELRRSDNNNGRPFR